MAKANKDGWIRHRGGKCPLADGVRVDYRLRSGSFGVNERAELLDWWRDNESPGSDIMAYRISQTDQQGIEKAFDMCVEKCAATEPGHVEMPAAKYFGGPLQWRDRIREIDAEEAKRNEEHLQAIEALEEERLSLVQKLEGEGLRLIEAKAACDGMPAEDMSDWHKWKVGDLIVITNLEDAGLCDYVEIDKPYKIIEFDGEEGYDGSMPVLIEVAKDETAWPELSGIRWHSRP